jgi:hypothetical protein
MPKNTLYVADLGLDEKRIGFIKGSKPEYAGFQGYVDEDAGLIVKTSGRRIEIIFYFPTAKDRARCPLCTVDPQSIADVPICELCPTIAVACSDEIGAGNKIVFTANTRIGEPATEPTFKWTVDEGTIVEGQGTSTITVYATNLKGKTITATVEVSGIDPVCPKTASCTTKIP